MNDVPQITVQLSGGLGNQLFEYATARRLALRSGLPLVLDTVSGFARDFYYRRAFQLHRFNIHCPVADPRNSYASLSGRIRRRVHRMANANQPLDQRFYIQERSPAFQPSLVDLRVTRPVYLEGMWQHEAYFRDIREQLLLDLEMPGLHDAVNLELAEKIKAVEAVCLHVRRLRNVSSFENTPRPATRAESHVSSSYYQRAIAIITRRSRNPHFFVFSDYPDWAREHLSSQFPMEFITHNGADKDHEDFWLMRLCRHFIIANSTFSWWAAWLAGKATKVVVAPHDALGHTLMSVPEEWLLA